MNSKIASRTLAITVLSVVVLLMPAILGHNEYLVSILVLMAINMLMVSSLRLISLLREISLGHVAFSLLGAYCSALLVLKGGLSFWPALGIAGLAAAAVAGILGYPFLRVRGLYFSILTLLTAETFRLVAYYWRKLTGGTMGLVGIPSPDPVHVPLIGTISFESTDAYYYLTVAVFAVCFAALYLIERSHLGFTWRAMRNGEELSQSVGINVIGYKILNFVIASFFAGIAGSLFAHFQHNLSADFSSRFGVVTSIYLLVYLVLGGQRSFVGPVIGTFVLTLVSEFARPMKQFQPMIIGGIAIAVMIFVPTGLTGLGARIKEGFSFRKRGGHG